MLTAKQAAELYDANIEADAYETLIDEAVKNAIAGKSRTACITYNDENAAHIMAILLLLNGYICINYGPTLRGRSTLGELRFNF